MNHREGLLLIKSAHVPTDLQLWVISYLIVMQVDMATMIEC